MPCASLLYTHPPESGECPAHPLKALAEGFEVAFTQGGILWVFPRVGQRHEDHPPLERPEGSPVDASETEQEVPSACPGEAPYPFSDASTATLTRTEAVSGRVLKGEIRHRSPNRGGDVGNALM